MAIIQLILMVFSFVCATLAAFSWPPVPGWLNLFAFAMMLFFIAIMLTGGSLAFMVLMAFAVVCAALATFAMPSIPPWANMIAAAFAFFVAAMLFASAAPRLGALIR